MFGRNRDQKARPAPLEWRLNGWDQPDLAHALPIIRSRGERWQTYVPAMELVPCGEVAKPALFVKVPSSEYDVWTQAVEPTEFVWRWHATKDPNPYVLLRLSVYVRNTAGTPIGLGGAGTITVMTHEVHDTYGHQLVCSALFDPGDPQHRHMIHAWATAPGPSMAFFVEENFDRANYLFINLSLDERAPALSALADAERELRQTPQIVPGSFPAATALVRESLPAVDWWR